MPLLRLKVCLLVAFALPPSFADGDKQMVRVRGILKCNGKPSSGDSVHLVDGYGPFAKKVHLTKVTTNNDGSFELKGSRPIN
ncbi:hypothetical protein AAVH_25030 [Aphelenchoides avenae]|nr:hypothetical protein AAVH_25030 [Aphelenchus avenae]